jgi:hypothetical protein
LTAAALVLLAFWLCQVAAALRGRHLLLRPAADPEPPADGLPTLSVVLAARDEAPAVEAALRSLLACRYPNCEVIAVDDRSRDGTGAILDRLAAQRPVPGRPRLRVVHLRSLPPGWLGKCHALWRGALAARGSWLLFTDADVIFRPDALARGVAAALRGGFDHVTLAPRLLAGPYLLQATVGAFATVVTTLVHTWGVRSPRSRTAFGIGAFNLVRAAAYRRVGGHAAIRMRPDDDVALGRLLKRAGFRSAVGVAGPLLAVRWYAGLGEMARGVEKNAPAATDYRWGWAVLAALGVLALYDGPFLLAALAQGPARALAAGAALLVLAAYAGVNAEAGPSPATVPAAPLGFLLLVAIYLRGVLLAAWRGEIRWRGRAYPLAELRRFAAGPVTRRPRRVPARPRRGCGRPGPG